MLVSVIIPMYNAEKYLDNLYASLQYQEYDSLEIIFVDNNSQDHSYEKACFFAKNDPEFRLTFDSKILTRRENLTLESGYYGEDILKENQLSK